MNFQKKPQMLDMYPIPKHFIICSHSKIYTPHICEEELHNTNNNTNNNNNDNSNDNKFVAT